MSFRHNAPEGKHDLHGAPQVPATGRATPWLILAVLLLFSIAAPLNQFKVPPVMPLLMGSFGLSVTGAGMLMSVFAITGLLLALPAGLIFQKLGVRATGLIPGVSLVIGGILGALSGGTATLFVSRVIEGIGTSFIAVLAPAVIGQWFSARRRGTAMGIWTAWVPLGQTAILLLAPAVLRGSNWRAVWWLGAAYALAATLLFLLFVRPAPDAATTQQAAGPVTSGQVLRSRSIWLLALAFSAFSAAFTGLLTYLPTFLSTQRDLSLSGASHLVALSTLVTMLAAPAGGVISDRLGSRRTPYMVSLAGLAVVLPLAAFLRGAPLLICLVLFGFFSGVVATNVYAAAVEAAGDQRLGGAAMAVIMVGRNAGYLLGPFLVGALADAAGWSVAFASLSAMALLGLLAASRARAGALPSRRAAPGG